KRQVHSKLGHHSDLFVRVGHGIFGLKQWDLPDDGSIANAAERIRMEAGVPLPVTVITEKVLETWIVNPVSVYAALTVDDRFVPIGRGTYALKDQLDGQTSGQVDPVGLFADELERWQAEQAKQMRNN